MNIAAHDYDLDEVDYIHQASVAVQNALPKVFLFNPAYVGDEFTVVQDSLTIKLKYIDVNGLSGLMVSYSDAKFNEDTFEVKVPVLMQKEDTKLPVGYGALIHQFNVEKEIEISMDSYNAIDQAIFKFINDQNLVFIEANVFSEAVDQINLNLPHLTCLLQEEIDFGEVGSRNEFMIGVHDQKVVMSITFVNGWQTDEWGDIAENYSCEMPVVIQSFNRESLLEVMKSGECFDSINYVWAEDFGNEAKFEDYLDKILAKINPKINFINGMKAFYREV